jgi:hypothetical protein
MGSVAIGIARARTAVDWAVNRTGYRSQGPLMEPNASSTPSEAMQTPAAKGLALVRVTIGTMFVWVFF